MVPSYPQMRESAGGNVSNPRCRSCPSMHPGIAEEVHLTKHSCLTGPLQKQAPKTTRGLSSFLGPYSWSYPPAILGQPKRATMHLQQHESPAHLTMVQIIRGGRSCDGLPKGILQARGIGTGDQNLTNMASVGCICSVFSLWSGQLQVSCKDSPRSFAVKELCFWLLVEINMVQPGKISPEDLAVDDFTESLHQSA